ncbi:MAG: hypothetical protein EBU46_19205, partial [Nitrosomonadaceae bacterium]|nr:hypothetical protein [Nitrosomonadaceae bacterium]
MDWPEAPKVSEARAPLELPEARAPLELPEARAPLELPEARERGRPMRHPAEARVRGRLMCHLVEAHVRAAQFQYACAAHVDAALGGLPPDASAAGVTPTARLPAGYFAAPRAEGRVLFVAPDRGPEFAACLAAAAGQLCLVLHAGAPDFCGTLCGPPEAVEGALAGAHRVLAAPPLTVLRRRAYAAASGARLCDVELARGSYDLLRGAPGL